MSNKLDTFILAIKWESKWTEDGKTERKKVVDWNDDEGGKGERAERWSGRSRRRSRNSSCAEEKTENLKPIRSEIGLH